MVPGTPYSHQPLLLWCPPSYLLPVTVVHKRGRPMTRTPLPQELKKAELEERPVGIPAFWVFCHLWALLSKILECCTAVMEVLRWDASPAWAGRHQALGALAERGGLGPRAGARGQGRESTDHGWSWGPDLKVFEEEFLDEEEEEVEVLVHNMKTSEGDDTPGEEGELDLSDWLEWESEELPCNCSDPSDNAPATRLTPTRNSLNLDGEQEEEEESDWSDDDDEDDDQEVDSALWESFLRSSDPLNPFRLSSPAEKGRVQEMEEQSLARPLHIAEGEGEQDDPPQAGRKAGKKVRFSEEVLVRPLVVWAFASRAARNGGCWLQMARDRDRFRRRVQLASDIISPILQSNHRASMWERCQLT